MRYVEWRTLVLFCVCSLVPCELFHLPFLDSQNLAYQFRKALRGVNRNPSDSLAVESPEMGFVASHEGLASVLDRGCEYGAVFFWQEHGEAWSG